ncbi:hypothetical protein HYQ46_007419 [Verticillium longisporum]|nr:hypothetical protein HYQ46_007419 [Verticillium longisporum]
MRSSETAVCQNANALSAVCIPSAWLKMSFADAGSGGLLLFRVEHENAIAVAVIVIIVGRSEPGNRFLGESRRRQRIARLSALAKRLRSTE